MKPHTRRRSIRLQNYDYSQPGAYFVTICTHKRECLFGHIEDRVIYYTIFGEIVCQEWSRSETIRQEIQMDVYVVMPNHLHGIVVITHSDGIVGAHGPGTKPPINSPGRTAGICDRAPLLPC